MTMWVRNQGDGDNTTDDTIVKLSYEIAFNIEVIFGEWDQKSEDCLLVLKRGFPVSSVGR